MSSCALRYCFNYSTKTRKDKGVTYHTFITIMWGIFLVLMDRIGLSPIHYLAALLNTTESALKLLISILMGYPLAIIYHKHVKQHAKFRNLYFLATGLDMAYYNFTTSFYHNLIPVIIMYLTTMILGAGKENAIFTFVFNMGYLVTGYAVTESENYDITWTMPHCVLTLKLIALSFDLWDGKKLIKKEELSFNNKKTALTAAPTFIELMGFVYFPACFLVGPIFSFKRYSDFIYGNFPLVKIEEQYRWEAVKRLLQGLLYLIAFQIGGKY